MILCVLVSSSHAQEADAVNVTATCDFSIQASADLTLNCSRRNINEVPETWPEQVNSIDKGTAINNIEASSSFITSPDAQDYD